MFPLIDRYIIKEVLQILIGVTVVLFLIFMSNKLVRLLADVAAGNLPGDVILVMMTLVSIRYFILMLPLSLFLSILMLMGRLYQDQEMSVMAACGIGPSRLYRPILWVAIPIMVFVAGMTLYVIPESAKLEVQMLRNAQKKLELTGFTAGQFRESQDEKRIFYIEEISPDKRIMKNVFIRLLLEDNPVVMSAESAKMVRDEKTGNYFLELRKGTRYEGEPGTHEFRRMTFEQHRLLVRQPDTGVEEAQQYAVSSSDLFNSSDTNDIAELQWRMSIPLSIIILALLAVPLAKVKPRQGQYGKLFVALLLYILYVNVLAMAKTWTAKGMIPPELGVWWVHASMLLIAVFILVRQLGPSWVRERLTGRGTVST